MRPTDVIRRDQLLLGEDRADLGIECVELRGADGHRHDEGRHDRRVLQLDEDRDRQVPWVGPGPRFDLLEAGDEREAGAVEVEVLDVEHLEAGLLEHRRGLVRQPDDVQAQAVGVVATLGVGEDVELDLADLLRLELLGDGRVEVLELGCRLRSDGGGDGGQDLRWDRPPVAVVRADHLHLVEAQAPLEEVGAHRCAVASGARHLADARARAGCHRCP